MADRSRPWLGAATVVGEHRYQRWLVIGLAVTLVLSLAPVVGAHVLGIAERPLSGSDHVGALCLIALHELLSPVHQFLHVLVAAGFAWAAAEAIWHAHHARRVLAGLPARPLTSREGSRVIGSGLEPDDIRVVAGMPVPAFTAGRWVRPRVYVAEALLVGDRALLAEEFLAVVSHEAAHVQRRDPVRFLMLRLLARALFWVPALRAISEDIADEAEVIADDAASVVTDPLTVASALVKLGAWRQPNEAAPWGIGFLRADLLERRVRRLVGQEYQPHGRLKGRSVLVAAVALSISSLSGIVDVHDLPTATGRATAHDHCAHDGVRATGHLFCRWDVPRSAWLTGGADCPHARH